MPRKKGDDFQGFMKAVVAAPWWVGVVLAVFIFVLLRFILPSINFGSPSINGLAKVGKGASYFLSFLILLLAVLSAWRAHDRKRLLDTQSSIESIRALDWKEFEQLLAEYDSRKGYVVTENETRGPDGGVDLRLQKDGNLYLVQCKQWRNFKVDVKVAREMLGIMTAERANRVIIITSGKFTPDATQFAENQPIDLIAGAQLVDMIRSVQPTRPEPSSSPAPTPVPVVANAPAASSAMLCPHCGKPLVSRTARKGPHAGKSFWGCSGYPACKYIKDQA